MSELVYRNLWDQLSQLCLPINVRIASSLLHVTDANVFAGRNGFSLTKYNFLGELWMAGNP